MSRLYNVPKDLLVKIIETIQKEYEKYILIETTPYDTRFREFDSEQKLKNYMLEMLSRREVYMSETEAIEDITYEFEQIYQLQVTIMKGKFLYP